MAYSVVSVRLEKGVIHCVTDTNKEAKIDFNAGVMYGVSGRPVGNLPAFKKYFMESFISSSESSPLFFRLLYYRRYDTNFASNYQLMKIIDRLINMGYDYGRIRSIIDYYNGWKGNGDLTLDATYKEIAKILKNAPQGMSYREAVKNYKKIEFYEILNKYSHSELLTEQDRDFLYRQIFNEWKEHQSLIEKHLPYFIYWTVFCELKYYWSMLVGSRYGHNDIFNTPFDYLKACEEMQIEPEKKNLYKHMATTHKAWQLWKDTKLNEKIAEKQIANRAKFFFEDENFTMVFPMTAAEFVAEGDALNNCLGWNHYADKVAEGDHIVCFIRYKNNPNKPYVACEIYFSRHGGYILNQFLGINNNTPDDVKALEYKQKLKMFLETLS